MLRRTLVSSTGEVLILAGLGVMSLYGSWSACRTGVMSMYGSWILECRKDFGDEHMELRVFNIMMMTVDPAASR